MAIHDVVAGPQTQNTNRRITGPKISDLRAALTAYNSTSYSAARLDGMLKNDMVSACKIHKLTVAGL